MSLVDLISTLMDDAEAAVVVTDGELKEPGPHILYVNAAFERMTGFGRDELLGRSPRMLQGPATSLAARKQLARALRSGRTHEASLVNYRKSGEAYRCAVRVFPVTGHDGRLVNAVAIEREVERRPGRPRKA